MLLKTQKIKSFFLLLLCLQTYSQTYKSIISFDSSNGLKSDIIYSITEDKKGYIWISTDNGIAKYNGTSFITFQKNDGLPSNDIITLIADKKNRVWLSGFFEGLYYIENNQIKKIPGSEKIKSLKYAFEKSGTLYFTNFINSESYFIDKHGVLKRNKITQNGLTVELLSYDAITKNYTGLIAKKRINCILNDQKKIIKYIPKKYAYCSNLVFNKNCFIYESSGMKPYVLNRDIINNFLTYDSNLYYKSLTVLKDKQFKNFQLLNNEYNSTYNIYLTENKNIYATVKGNYDPILSKKIENIPYDLSLVHVIFIDRYHNFWIIDKSNRLTFFPYNYNNIKNYTTKEILKNENDGVKSAQTIGDYFYYLTSKNILYKYDIKNDKNEIIKIYKTEKPYKILINNLNEIIVACYDGFDFFESNKVGKLTNTYFIKNISRNSNILKDTIYFTDANSIYKFHKKKSLLFTDNKSIRFNYIHTSDGINFVFANEEKIVRYNIEKKLIISNSSIQNTNVIHSTSDFILIGTNFNGLYILNKELKIKKRILPNLNIYKISSDANKKYIFLGTNEGLYIYNNSFDLVKKITIENGIINGKVNSIISTNSKIIYSTKNGFSIINTETEKTKLKGEIEIDKIYNYNKLTKIQDNILIKRNKNNLTIFTSIFTFNKNSVFRKKYLLSKNGIKNNTWVEYQENKIVFRELAPGEYTLQLIATENNYNNPEKIKTIHFIVEYHFWETLLFKISLIICVLLISLLIVLYYKRKTERKFNRKLRLQHLELKALKSQMNPHFIFNALNNFQSLLIVEGIEKSNIFLSLFSKLIRTTLEIVIKDIITLNEEFEYLKKYIAFEIIKNPDIEVKFIIEENINLDKINVPVMLIQPIVENAFLHGFNNQIKSKKIIIEVKSNLNEKMMEISISDNGIGINNKIEKSHTSFATSIIHERIQLFNQSKKKKIEFKIIDLKNSVGNQGTKVVIMIPYDFKY